MGWKGSKKKKLWDRDERTLMIKQWTPYNDDGKYFPLAHKAREIKKEHPFWSSRNAFDEAEKVLKKKGYKAAHPGLMCTR